MKISFPLAFLLALAGAPGLAQPPSAPLTAQGTLLHAPNPDELTKFDLDFPGGSPKDLVAAIQKAMGRTLNVIVRDQDSADVVIPALKMEHVAVPQLFDAISAASRIDEAVPSGRNTYSVVTTSYGFNQVGPRANGPIPIGVKSSDDTIWYFYVQKPTVHAYSATPVCRFYSLAPYLDRRLTVDDITTAIETGWKMIGENHPPKISFHKDTKLLIAVGEPDRLETIDAVLKALGTPESAAGAQAPAQPSK